MQAKHLTEKDITFFKKQLLEMKKEAESYTESADNQEDELAAVTVNNHPADLGTEQFEQERDASLEYMRQDDLHEIDHALQKIEEGTYGLSEKSGKPIPKERLEALPTARMLVEEASDTN
ncbi:hypothetical protein [Oceanobacillus timonensis]|uniref:hypothetical protein n=1 Tax=Oceanobacillus timonensis TaxID=1926285 RepID=UPI0009B9F173|nr:hypothetical protein [Oceanobacillus timonensis]